MKSLLVKFFIIIVIIVPMNIFAEGFGGDVEFSRMIDEFEGLSICNTDLGLYYDFNFHGISVKPWTNINTWMIYPDQSAFAWSPFRDRYTLGTTVKWNGIGIEYDHYCEHAVWSTEEANALNKTYNSIKYQWEFPGSKVTKYSINYTYEISGFEIYGNVSKTIETKSYFLNAKLSYTYSIKDFTAKIFYDYGYWSGNVEKERTVKTYGLNLDYKGFNVGVEKYSSSRTLEKLDNNNHLYNENPLIKSAVYIYAGYEYKGE